MRTTMSSIEDRRRGRSGAPTTGPAFVLTGAVRAGSVEIRAPRRKRWFGRG
jgi:hypothetical protein